ncbi:ComEC/Rec2 family competence protein [Micrococcus luteus]|uniref:ComEC/Rec2 family competence protein n=1 Tax=Micrococcus luteus TaxID=1270 RepID=UPI00211BAEDC|nr:ComEC/Rec2 family competence protein [Micrococcus luteus]
MLGDRSAQGAALDDAMKASGLSHLSAVSGANVAMILGAVAITLRCARVHRAVVLSAGLAVLGVFVVVVGPEPSVLRAAVMGALGALAVFFGRARQAFGLLTVGGTALLVAVPALAVEPAFHLSWPRPRHRPGRRAPRPCAARRARPGAARRRGAVALGVARGDRGRPPGLPADHPGHDR